MQCEVCGHPIVGNPCRVVIEGAKMTTCAKCAKLGSAHWEDASQSSRSSAKRGFRTTVRRVPVRRKSSERVSEDIVVAEGFGTLVRKAREKSGLSHEDLGRKIREKVSVIKKVESGKMMPDHRLAAKLEHALGVSLLVPLAEPEVTFASSPRGKGVTLGEIVHLKNRKKEASKERRQS